MISLRFVCLSAALLGSTSVAVRDAEAQTRSALIGTIKGRDGTAVSGVTMTLASASLSGEALTATTTTLGRYRFSELPPGVYELSAARAGAQTLTRSNLRLPVGTTLTVDLILSTTETGTVILSGAGPVVDVTTPASATTLLVEDLENLPINANALLRLVPGVTPRAAFIGRLVAAQAPAPIPGAAPAGEVVVGSGNYSPIVQDLDKAIDFYGGLLGLTVPPPPAPGPRPVNTDPALLAMFGMPAAQLRFVTARIPGATVGVEMVEVRGLEKRAVRPRPQDPGGTTLILLVRDINAAFAPLKKAGVPVVTPGGEPIAFGPNNGVRGVIVADPDGHFVELLQGNPVPETTAPESSNIIGARVRMTVADTDQTLKVYRDLLQFQLQVGEFSTIPLVDLMGLKGAQLRLTNARVPGSPLGLEFIELKGVDRTPIHPRLQDPGATRLQVRLRDLDATLAKFKAAGSSVVSTGSQPATLNGGIRAAIMPDPNGIYFVLMQAAPPRPNP